MTDEELILDSQKGNEQATNELLTRYKGLVKSICKKYYLINAEESDLLQEGMIGLFNACRTYKLGNKVPFKTYAGLCIKHQIMTALKNNNRQKNQMLNAYFSINNQGKINLSASRINDFDEEKDNGFYLEATALTPEESVLFKEKLSEFLQKINDILSTFEKRVLMNYMSGLNYQEIAIKLKKQPKSIDNALSRIKIKLRDLKGEI